MPSNNPYTYLVNNVPVDLFSILKSAEPTTGSSPESQRVQELGLVR